MAFANEFYEKLKKYCEENNLPVPELVKSGPCVIASRALGDQIRRHHERQRQKQADQQKNTP